MRPEQTPHMFGACENVGNPIRTNYSFALILKGWNITKRP